jgi:hypothetical protein
MIDGPAFQTKQLGNLTIAISATPLGQSDHRQAQLFIIILESSFILPKWRVYYNTVSPHNVLGYKPPALKSIVPIDQRHTMH